MQKWLIWIFIYWYVSKFPFWSVQPTVYGIIHGINYVSISNYDVYITQYTIDYEHFTKHVIFCNQVIGLHKSQTTVKGLTVCVSFDVITHAPQNKPFSLRLIAESNFVCTPGVILIFRMYLIQQLHCDHWS